MPLGRRTVALDGVDGAGKTVLARELTELVGPHREVHRSSVDGFHRTAPASRATWVLDNTDLAAPVLTGSAAGRGRAAPPTASG
jgi:hypothetical protein